MAGARKRCLQNLYSELARKLTLPQPVAHNVSNLPRFSRSRGSAPTPARESCCHHAGPACAFDTETSSQLISKQGAVHGSSLAQSSVCPRVVESPSQAPPRRGPSLVPPPTRRSPSRRRRCDHRSYQQHDPDVFTFVNLSTSPSVRHPLPTGQRLITLPWVPERHRFLDADGNENSPRSRFPATSPAGTIFTSGTNTANWPGPPRGRAIPGGGVSGSYQNLSLGQTANRHAVQAANVNDPIFTGNNTLQHLSVSTTPTASRCQRLQQRRHSPDLSPSPGTPPPSP